MARSTKNRVSAGGKAYNVRWTNKYSHEEGFVSDINDAEKHFVNTFEKKEAKKFASSLDAAKAVEALISMGEGENNIFNIETA